MTYTCYLWCKILYQIWPNPPKLQSGSINVLQVWLCSWCTHNHARELKKIEYNSGMTNYVNSGVKFYIGDNPNLYISSQEPPMSSKYDCVLDALLFMLGSWKLTYNLKMSNDGYSWCQMWYQIWPNPPTLHSGIINVLQVWLCSCCTFNHAKELKIGIQLNNDILWLFVMSNLILNMTQSSKTPVRNHQHLPCMTMSLMHF